MGKSLKNQHLNLGDLDSMNELMYWFKQSEAWATIEALFTIVSIFVTVGTLIMVVKNYRANKKQLQKIDIFLHIENGTQKTLEKLPTYIIRKNFTRAELFGILSVLHSEDKFKIDYLGTVEFMEKVYQIQAGKENNLIIKISSEDNFHWKK